MHFVDKPIFRSVTLWNILLVITIIFIITTGYIPQIARSTRPDAVGRNSMWLHGFYAPDFRVYLSAITLGQHGYTLFRNPFTTENFQPLPYYLYYIAFGWITGPIHLWPPYVYHLAKLVAILIFVGSVYYLARVILKKPWQAALATILTLVTTTLPEWFYNQNTAVSFTAWWRDQLYATDRLDNRPHYVLSEALLALSVALFIRVRQTNDWKFVVGTSISGALTALMVPHAALPFLFVISLNCFIRFIELLKQRSTFRTIASAWLPITICIPTLFTVWILQQYALSDFVWLAYRDWEVTFWNRDPMFWYHWYVTFLPLIIPSIITWIWALRRKRTDFILMTAWTLFPLLLYPFTDLLYIGKARLLHSAIEIPLGITATYAIVSILPKYLPKLVLVFSTTAFIIYSFIMISMQSKVMWNKAMQEYPWYSLIYVPKEYIEAIDEVGKVVPTDSHMLTGDALGNLLPGFDPIVNYIGYATQTYKWDEKLVNARLFYSGAMTNDEASRFLKVNGITYIIDDQETKIMEPQPMTYPFLKPIWHNTLVTLYQVE